VDVEVSDIFKFQNKRFESIMNVLDSLPLEKKLTFEPIRLFLLLSDIIEKDIGNANMEITSKLELGVIWRDI